MSAAIRAWGSRSAFDEYFAGVEAPGTAHLVHGTAYLLQADGDIAINSAMAEGDQYGLRRHASNEPGLMVDIGMNIADVTTSMAKLNPRKQIIAIEAIPTSYFYALFNLHLNGIKLLSPQDIGPDGPPGVLALHGAAGGDGGGTIEMQWTGTRSQKAHALSTASASSVGRNLSSVEMASGKFRRASVPVTFVPKYLGGWKKVDLFKIDCEGCEYAVMPASAHWLSDRKAVQVFKAEIHIPHGSGFSTPDLLAQQATLLSIFENRRCSSHTMKMMREAKSNFPVSC